MNRFNLFIHALQQPDIFMKGSYNIYVTKSH